MEAQAPKIHGLVEALPRRNSAVIHMVTTNGYTISLSPHAYDAAAAVGSNAATDLAAIVAKIVALPIRDDECLLGVRDAFRDECLDGVDTGTALARAWIEYADALVSAAIHQAPETHDQQRMLITRHGQCDLHAVMLVTVIDALAPCPACGNDDVDAWADDGEADEADWWECKRCGCSGAFLHTDPSKFTTPNDLPPSYRSEES
jgi:hypothetical protein